MGQAWEELRFPVPSSVELLKNIVVVFSRCQDRWCPGCALTKIWIPSTWQENGWNDRRMTQKKGCPRCFVWGWARVSMTNVPLNGTADWNQVFLLIFFGASDTAINLDSTASNCYFGDLDALLIVVLVGVGAWLIMINTSAFLKAWELRVFPALNWEKRRTTGLVWMLGSSLSVVACPHFQRITLIIYYSTKQKSLSLSKLDLTGINLPNNSWLLTPPLSRCHTDDFPGLWISQSLPEGLRFGSGWLHVSWKQALLSWLKLDVFQKGGNNIGHLVLSFLTKITGYLQL